MAKDDFVRIIYRKEVEGRKKRTSISVDPDLYQTFCLIRGGASAARATMRAWAVEVDLDRDDDKQGAGISRLVHRRMMQEIRIVVEKGLVVERAQRSGHQSVSLAEMDAPAQIIVTEQGRKGAGVGEDWVDGLDKTGDAPAADKPRRAPRTRRVKDNVDPFMPA
jgi:hypothetical protein